MRHDGQHPATIAIPGNGDHKMAQLHEASVASHVLFPWRQVRISGTNDPTLLGPSCLGLDWFHLRVVVVSRLRFFQPGLGCDHRVVSLFYLHFCVGRVRVLALHGADVSAALLLLLQRDHSSLSILGCTTCLRTTT